MRDWLDGTNLNTGYNIMMYCSVEYTGDVRLFFDEYRDVESYHFPKQSSRRFLMQQLIQGICSISVLFLKDLDVKSST